MQIIISVVICYSKSKDCWMLETSSQMFCDLWSLYILVFKSLGFWIRITEFPIKSSHQLHFWLSHAAHDKQNIQSKFTTAIRWKVCVYGHKTKCSFHLLKFTMFTNQFTKKSDINQQYNSIQIMNIRKCFWNGTRSM